MRIHSGVDWRIIGLTVSFTSIGILAALLKDTSAGQTAVDGLLLSSYHDANARTGPELGEYVMGLKQPVLDA